MFRMSFKTKKYEVLKQAIPKSLANFIFNYLLIQRGAVDYLVKKNQTNPFNPFIGTREDQQVPGCYSKYGDWAMEALLMQLLPLMIKKTGLKLIPTYTYMRMYENGNILRRHKDRPSCEISTTLHLGGDDWPIFLYPSGQEFVIDEFKQIHKPNAPKGIKVNLDPGDMLIYSGCDLEHWREPFEGEACAQVFLHYNNGNGPFGKDNLYDKRPILGIPKS